MADGKVQGPLEPSTLNGDQTLEARVRNLFTRQAQLRERLEATRAELDRVNEEVLRSQMEYCTTPEREEEYHRCVEKVLGFERLDLREIEEAKKNPIFLEDLLRELELDGKS